MLQLLKHVIDHTNCTFTLNLAHPNLAMYISSRIRGFHLQHYCNLLPVGIVGARIIEIPG
jgi:hypothetical protein